MSTGEPKCGLCGSDLMSGMFHHCTKPVECPGCVSLKLQKDELVAVAKRHREERDHYRDETQLARLQRDGALRLNDETVNTERRLLRGLLEGVCCLDSTEYGKGWADCKDSMLQALDAEFKARPALNRNGVGADYCHDRFGKLPCWRPLHHGGEHDFR